MKTIEEEAKKEWDKLLPDSGVNPYYSEGFAAGVQLTQRWIPITEELPELHKDVLIKDDTGLWDKGQLIHTSGDNMWASSSGDIGRVVEWKPVERK